LVIINLSIDQFRNLKLFVTGLMLCRCSRRLAICSSHLPIIRVDLFGTDVVEAIAPLDAQPEKLERINTLKSCYLKFV
jgi:hypothetical protein